MRVTAQPNVMAFLSFSAGVRLDAQALSCNLLNLPSQRVFQHSRFQGVSRAPWHVPEEYVRVAPQASLRDSQNVSAPDHYDLVRSEERREGKSVDLGGRRIS